jgi:pimeloyl-ACP methyl ester carboxylesterase
MIQKRQFFLQTKREKRLFSLDFVFDDAAGAQPLLIFLHGFKGFKDWGAFPLLSDFWVRQGFTTIRLNFSHNGTTIDNPLEIHDLEAFRKNTFTKEMDDIEVVLDFFLNFEMNNYIDASRIALVGHSRGGSTALFYAMRDKRVSAVVTWAAVGDVVGRYFDDQAPDFAEWERRGFKFVLNGRTGQQLLVGFDFYRDYLHQEKNGNFSYDLKKSIADLKIPILLLHGDADESVPASEAQLLKKAQPAAELCIIENANHTFGMQHPYEGTELPPLAQLAAEKTVSFLKKMK